VEAASEYECDTEQLEPRSERGHDRHCGGLRFVSVELLQQVRDSGR
jgi:hypothetical protein